MDASIDMDTIEQNRQLDGWIKAQFIRKVYSILSAQLVVTVGLIVGLIYAAFLSGDPKYPTHFGHWLSGPGYYLGYVLFLCALFVLCGLLSVQYRYPANMIGLGLFTLLISFFVGQLVVVYYGHGAGQQVLLAFIITCASFICLTLFTIFSKIDFSFLAPFLCLGTYILLIWSLILSIALTVGGFHASWGIVLVILGVVLFTGFIIFDTYNIITYLGVDDYIVAAVELYLDVVNMFLYILTCLSLGSGGQS